MREWLNPNSVSISRTSGAIEAMTTPKQKYISHTPASRNQR